ncbi:GTP-binding protein Rheb [Puma concolor]|uniref:GTP-binding protein Rheb n=1 Tax=Puma concolor TaxID=9696 RepID=A0A6P6IAH9_PUMCO|nr:GTP-binding protein Rheb [Puma concolor]
MGKEIKHDGSLLGWKGPNRILNSRAGLAFNFTFVVPTQPPFTGTAVKRGRPCAFGGKHGDVPLKERPAHTGKSSLTIQFVEGQFVDSYDPTIENTFTKLITVNGQEYHLQLVDTAGQDEYSIFPQTYSIDINGYILVYSVTSIKSFEVIKVIHGKLLDMVGKVQIPIMLVGNKKDLHMERVISYEEGKALAESWNAAFLESSAKENQTAVDVFRRIILEAEKIDGAASQGKSSCSVM